MAKEPETAIIIASVIVIGIIVFRGKKTESKTETKTEVKETVAPELKETVEPTITPITMAPTTMEPTTTPITMAPTTMEPTITPITMPPTTLAPPTIEPIKMTPVYKGGRIIYENEEQQMKNTPELIENNNPSSETPSGKILYRDGKKVYEIVIPSKTPSGEIVYEKKYISDETVQRVGQSFARTLERRGQREIY